jgi:hypothetical protein
LDAGTADVGVEQEAKRAGKQEVKKPKRNKRSRVQEIRRTPGCRQ